MTIDYALRQATAEDQSFLWELKLSTVRAYVGETIDWDEDLALEQIDQELEGAQVIVLQGRPIGALCATHEPSALWLRDISLLPSYRNLGIGSAVVRQLQDQARLDRVPIVLTVHKANPAVWLYRRLDFVVQAETESHYEMAWTSLPVQVSQAG